MSSPRRVTTAAWPIYMAVFFGGALGAAVRESLVLFGEAAQWPENLMILVVNCVASLFLGWATGMWDRGRGMGGNSAALRWRSFISPGFVGGFGSVSAVTLLASDIVGDLGVLSLHVGAALVCAGVGFWLARFWKPRGSYMRPELWTSGGDDR
ncbi:CrcB family protein [Pseudoglutamicibacter albus]|uniref:fluoride efflux transporter FluC n=1 Tax=Pseudoglutamicibacter albus TaxID=98671 RepID=UPI001EF4A2CC|nr:CrcB family protein [Pseudoglutamicibacter albus]MCG7305255.1 CrcB family protein [Pseudoglutamicibacter albus]